MEKISEVWGNIKDRLTNPLLFSFFCSWLIFNWEIPVSLIWYDSEQIKVSGHNSIFQFIHCKLNKEHSFLYPILFAIFYTLLIPIIRNGISILTLY